MVRKKKEGEKFINYSFKIPPAMLGELRAVQERTHVLVAEQIRQGIMLWLAKQAKAKKRRG